MKIYILIFTFFLLAEGLPYFASHIIININGSSYSIQDYIFSHPGGVIPILQGII
jgi:hypothetical protein